MEELQSRTPELENHPSQTVSPALKEAKNQPLKKQKRKYKKRKTRASLAKSNTVQRKRGKGSAKSFPGASFESVLSLAKAIFESAGASREIKRQTVFGILQKSADSGAGRALIINSGKYGLTVGGVQAETLRLTDNAVKILDPGSPANQAMRAKFALAVENVPPFKALYEKFKGGKLPATEVMKDELAEVDPADRGTCVDIFVGNLKFVGLLRVIDGAEQIVLIEEAQENPVSKAMLSSPIASSKQSESEQVNFEKICFLVAPIGEEGTVERKHSDMILAQFVERALKEFGLKVVRADKIADPGTINGQIGRYILNSRLVVADMSFHNPNVFYELCMRHMLGKPVVHIIRKGEKIPFDVGNFRTVEVDEGDKYELLAKLETSRAEIANFARAALDGSSSSDNPIHSFFPGLKITIEEGASG